MTTTIRLAVLHALRAWLQREISLAYAHHDRAYSLSWPAPCAYTALIWAETHTPILAAVRAEISEIVDPVGDVSLIDPEMRHRHGLGANAQAAT